MWTRGQEVKKFKKGVDVIKVWFLDLAVARRPGAVDVDYVDEFRVGPVRRDRHGRDGAGVSRDVLVVL